MEWWFFIDIQVHGLDDWRFRVLMNHLSGWNVSERDSTFCISHVSPLWESHIEKKVITIWSGQNKPCDVTLTFWEGFVRYRSYSSWSLAIDMISTTDLGCNEVTSCFEYGTNSIRTHKSIMKLFHTTQNVEGCTIFEWKYLISIMRRINIHSYIAKLEVSFSSS